MESDFAEHLLGLNDKAFDDTFKTTWRDYVACLARHLRAQAGAPEAREFAEARVALAAIKFAYDVRRRQAMRILQAPRRCGSCQKADGKRMQCSRCKMEAYCSRECQAKAWVHHHKEACPKLKAKRTDDSFTLQQASRDYLFDDALSRDPGFAQCLQQTQKRSVLPTTVNFEGRTIEVVDWDENVKGCEWGEDTAAANPLIKALDTTDEAKLKCGVLELLRALPETNGHMPQEHRKGERPYPRSAIIRVHLSGFLTMSRGVSTVFYSRHPDSSDDNNKNKDEDAERLVAAEKLQVSLPPPPPPAAAGKSALPMFVADGENKWIHVVCAKDPDFQGGWNVAPFTSGFKDIDPTNTERLQRDIPHLIRTGIDPNADGYQHRRRIIRVHLEGDLTRRGGVTGAFFTYRYA